MMRKLNYHIALSFVRKYFIFFPIVVQTGIAAQPGADDSIHTYTFHEFLVTANGISLGQTMSPSRLWKMTRRDIDAGNGTTVGEMLSGTPGTFVQLYGVGGSLQTLALRGMDAEHTLALLDGVPINNIQTGLVDLRLIPLDDVEQVETVRGGGSGVYGSNALGGVLNILTTGLSKSAYTRVEGDVGSFDLSRFAVSSHILPADDFQMTFGYAQERGRNNFPFTFQQNEVPVTAERSNSDDLERSGFMKLMWQSSSRVESNFFVNYVTADRGTPGPLLTIENQGTARQADEQLQAIASSRFLLADNVLGSVSGSFQNAYEHYVDAGGTFPADNYYRNLLYQISSRLQYFASPDISFQTGGEFGNAIAIGNALPDEKIRTQASVFISSEMHDDFGLTEFRFGLFPSMRYDHFNPVQEAWSPRLGGNIESHFDEMTITFHAAAGKDFRVPTFNELFFSGAGGTGNPLLQPERSVSGECGLTFDYHLFGFQEFDATYYSISTDNRIYWLPTSAQFVSPQNIENTRSSGLETELRWHPFSEHISVEGTYSWIDAVNRSSNNQVFGNQLPYIPLETGGGSISCDFPVDGSFFSSVFGKVSDSYTGQRFITEDDQTALPSYHVLNGNIGCEIILNDIPVRIKYEVNNVADVSYVGMPGYPMPLRNQQLSVTVTKNY